MTMEESKLLVLQEVVDQAAESFESRIEKLAKRCTNVFDLGDGKTQMSNLERAGLVSRRFGDIVAFVKRQTGKENDKNRRWSKRSNGGKCLGEELLDLLGDIRSVADGECAQRQIAELRNDARVRTAGATLRNLHSAYLYEAAMRESQ